MSSVDITSRLGEAYYKMSIDSILDKTQQLKRARSTSVAAPQNNESPGKCTQQ